MYSHDIDCIYFKYGPSICKKFGRRNQKCVADKSCKSYVKINISALAFDDSKWAWKTGMNLLTRAYWTLVRGEQAKIEKNKEVRDACYERGHYHFIARQVESILGVVVHLRKHFGESKKKIKFLDCGCGIGNVVALACLGGFDAHGVEFDDHTLRKGKIFMKRFALDPKRLHKGDLLEYPHFGDYDVLYGYHPLCDGKKERQFEHRLFRDMKTGAIVVGLSPMPRTKIGPRERVYFQRLMLRKSEYDIANGMMKVAHEKR